MAAAWERCAEGPFADAARRQAPQQLLATPRRPHVALEAERRPEGAEALVEVEVERAVLERTRGASETQHGRPAIAARPKTTQDDPRRR